MEKEGKLNGEEAEGGRGGRRAGRVPNRGCLRLCTSARGWVRIRARALATAEAVNRARASCALCRVQMRPRYTPWSPGTLKDR